MPNPESKEERNVKTLIKVMNRNESGKTINGRELAVPVASLI